jgi:hypothetical protein
VITRRTGLVAGAALAAGLAIGFAGSAMAANPTASPDYHSMMGGRGMMGGGGMMGGASFAPGSTFGSGMMGGLSQEQRQQVLQRCDKTHDAMRDALSASPSPSTSPAPR